MNYFDKQLHDFADFNPDRSCMVVWFVASGKYNKHNEELLSFEDCCIP
jgi:hypothetical protein